MTQDEILDMAKQVDREFCIDEESFNWIEAFAKLVAEAAASKERERLAQEARECGGVLTVGAILAKGGVIKECREPLTMFETEKLAKRFGVEWTTKIHALCSEAANGI
jgi:hypothetical protein